MGRAVCDDDIRVVEQSVQQADGGGVLGQEPAPLVERPMAGDPEDPPFVGRCDKPEQQLGPAGHRAGLRRAEPQDSPRLVVIEEIL